MSGTSPFTWPMRLIYTLATSPEARELSVEQLRDRLGATPHVMDEAVADTWRSFETDPGLCYSFVDMCKAIIPRHLSVRRQIEEHSREHGPIQVFTTPSDRPVGEYLAATPDTAIYNFYMSMSGEVVTAVASNVGLSPGQVRYTLFDVIGTDQASDFLALVTAYAASLRAHQPDFELLEEILQALSLNIMQAMWQLGRPRKLILIPHRALNIVPLHAVHVSDGTSTWYLDQFVEDISYRACLASLSTVDGMLSRPSSTHGAMQSVAVVDSRAGLPGVTRDIAYFRVMNQLGMPVRMIEQPADVTGRFDDCWWLSWCGHAHSDSSAWGASWLQLGESRFRAGTIVNEWDLRSRPVAALSTCESAVDVSAVVDDNCGLDVALLVAGARAVLGTLWSIADPVAALATLIFHGWALQGVTSEACGLFQRGLREGYWHQFLPTDAQIAAAPHAAQEALAVLRDGWLAIPEKAFAHPKHWSAFKCVIG